MSQKTDHEHLDYPALGLTRLAAERPADPSQWPAGFAHVDKTIQVGAGQQVFEALAEGIMTWEIQRRAGLSVNAPARAVVGAKVVSGFGVGALRLPVPCRVVWAMESQTITAPGGSQTLVAGFGYGTLPGHPALGEEAFTAMKTSDGGVYFRLLAFSKPAGLIYALGSPVTRLTQAGVSRSYQQAARQLAGGF